MNYFTAASITRFQDHHQDTRSPHTTGFSYFRQLQQSADLTEWTCELSALALALHRMSPLVSINNRFHDCVYRHATSSSTLSTRLQPPHQTSKFYQELRLRGLLPGDASSCNVNPILNGTTSQNPEAMTHPPVSRSLGHGKHRAYPEP